MNVTAIHPGHSTNTTILSRNKISLIDFAVRKMTPSHSKNADLVVDAYVECA